ncbi:MAG: peptidylprolyl isomerase [Candidatus Omnitrophota bacterium]
MSCVTIRGRYIRILSNIIQGFTQSISVFIAGIAILFLMNGCSHRNKPVPVESVNIVAVVNGIVVTDADLQFEVEYYNTGLLEHDPAGIHTLSGKADYLKEEIVQRLLLYQEAVKRGLDKSEKFKRLMEKNRQETLALLLINEETGILQTSEEEADKYYRDYQLKLSNLEERHIREILLPTEKEAQDILIRLLQGEDFAVLAEAYSKADSRSNGGDAGFLKKGKRAPAFDKAVFSPDLREGNISSVFFSPEGYFIVKVEDIRRFQGRPLEDMRGEIGNKLLREKKQDKIEKLLLDLRNNSSLEIHEGSIK